MFESSVNSYDSQTDIYRMECHSLFESSVNSYDSQTDVLIEFSPSSLRVV